MAMQLYENEYNARNVHFLAGIGGDVLEIINLLKKICGNEALEKNKQYISVQEKADSLCARYDEALKKLGSEKVQDAWVKSIYDYTRELTTAFSKFKSFDPNGKHLFSSKKQILMNTMGKEVYDTFMPFLQMPQGDNSAILWARETIFSDLGKELMELATSYRTKYLENGASETPECQALERFMSNMNVSSTLEQYIKYN